MSTTTIALVLLGAVDVAGVLIGLSIRRTVKRIVKTTAANIEAAVRDGIAEAISALLHAVVPLLRPGGGPPDPEAAARLAEEALERLKG